MITFFHGISKPVQKPGPGEVLSILMILLIPPPTATWGDVWIVVGMRVSALATNPATPTTLMSMGTESRETQSVCPTEDLQRMLGC